MASSWSNKGQCYCHGENCKGFASEVGEVQTCLCHLHVTVAKDLLLGMQHPIGSYLPKYLENCQWWSKTAGNEPFRSTAKLGDNLDFFPQLLCFVVGEGKPFPHGQDTTVLREFSECFWHSVLRHLSARCFRKIFRLFIRNRLFSYAKSKAILAQLKFTVDVDKYRKNLSLKGKCFYDVVSLKYSISQYILQLNDCCSHTYR